MTTAAQIRAIQSLRRQIPHYAEDDYRAMLRANFGVTSCKLLSEQQARKCIDILKALAGQHAHVRRASGAATGPYAPKLQALWIGAHNLGLTRSRDDRALLAFVERQTGLSHTRFLTDPADAMKAIEALKKWMARDGGVDWPKDRADAEAAKRAVAEAVMRKCIEAGAFTTFMEGVSARDARPDFERYGYTVGGLPASFEFYEAAHWDRLASKLGARLRFRLGAKRKAAA